MRQEFSDRATFLKATAILREAVFHGRDVVHDAAARTLTVTLTRADRSKGGAGGFLASRRPAWIRTIVVVRQVVSCTRYLAGADDDVYVIDRAEVGRGGRELAFFFRPGDRAVMDVDAIEGFVEDAGRATAVPRRPFILNPLRKQERGAAGGKPGAGTKGGGDR